MAYEEPAGYRPRSRRVPNAIHLPRLKRRGRLVMPIGLLEEILDENGQLMVSLGRDGESIFLFKTTDRKDRPEEMTRVAMGFSRQRPHKTNHVSPTSYEVSVVFERKSINLPIGRWLGLDRLYLDGEFLGFRLYYIPGEGVSREEVKRPEIEQKIIIRPLEIGWPLVWPNGGFISFHDMRRAIERSKVLEVGLCTQWQDLKLQEMREEDDYEEE